jgi:hypothetical protein
MTDRQCSSCGGICGRGGCKRENVKPPPARLIAAAPDLLEALEDLVLLAQAVMHENGGYMVDDELSDARAAIAKAKG